MINTVTSWFNSLLGRPRQKKESVKTDKKPVEKKEVKTAEYSVNQEVDGDSVQKDIEVAENFIRSITNRLSNIFAPVIAKKPALEIQKVTTPFNKIPFEGLKKVIYPFMVLILVLVVFFVGIGIFRILREGGDERGRGGVEEMVTPVVYRPKEPSVYANDPQIIQIETDINVLLGEMSSKVLKESTLIPPRLDFNISFD
jgi:hypothetical protein